MFKVIELFSGIGSQAQALKMLGANAEIVGTSEINKKAIKVYEAIHGKTKQYGDISKVEQLDYADMWTYSFPCQDISSMGKQKGLSQGSGTRSSLVYEVLRLLGAADKKPTVLLLENVEELCTKFKDDFTVLREQLQELGYVTYLNMFDVVDSVDYGIPQTRKRTIAVSFLEEKIQNMKQAFIFPKKNNIGYNPMYCLRDFIEESTPEIMAEYGAEEKFLNDIANTSDIDGDIVLDGVVRNNKISKRNLSFEVCPFKQRRRIIETNGVCPTLLTTGGHGVHKIFVNEVYEQDSSCGFMQTRRKAYDIRYLTPREYWRLMGFDDKTIDKVVNLKGITGNDMYRQAGNSIVTNVLYFVFKAIIDCGIIEGATYDKTRTDTEKLTFDFLQKRAN